MGLMERSRGIEVFLEEEWGSGQVREYCFGGKFP